MYCIHSSKSFCVAYFHHSTVLSKLHVFFFLRIQTVNGQQKMARLRWRWIRQVSRHYVSLILWYNVRLALIVLKKAMHVTLIKISITLIKISTSFLFLIISCLENIFCWQQKNILRQLHDLVKSCIFLMIERF